MANRFNTDYSFLNLPEAGSDVSAPIEAPSFDPNDFSFNADRYAPNDLPTVDTFAPSGPSLTSDQNDSVLNSARPFEDIESLGATFGARLAGVEKFFGDRVSGLQGNIDDLINTKSDLTKQLEAAFLQQDEMSQQAIEEQIAALDAQRAELVTQLEQSVAEAEENGVDAVSAAEAVSAEKIAQLDQQIAQTAQELQDAVAQQDIIRQEESEKRLSELENQKVTLTEQFNQQSTSLQEQFGQRENELTGTIDTLQGEINEITGARDSAVAERDQALADNDTIRAEAANSQAQALDAQAGDYQAQLDEMTGQSGQYETQLSERDQTIADLQAQLEGMQVPPGETPPPPPGETPPGGATGAPEGMMSYQDFLAQGGSAEDYQNYLNKFLFSSDNLNFQMDGLQNPSQEVIDTVQNSLATGVPAITNDGVQDMIDSMGNGIVKLPPQKNPRDDFMSIERLGGNDKPGKMPPPLIVAPKDIGVPTIVNPRVTGPDFGGPVIRLPVKKPVIAKLPPIKTKRDDFMSIAQKPKMNPRTDGIGRFLGKKLARMGRR